MSGDTGSDSDQKERTAISAQKRDVCYITGPDNFRAELSEANSAHVKVDETIMQTHASVCVDRHCHEHATHALSSADPC